MRGKRTGERERERRWVRGKRTGEREWVCEREATGEKEENG